jgi:hypothetical protein
VTRLTLERAIAPEPKEMAREDASIGATEAASVADGAPPGVRPASEASAEETGKVEPTAPAVETEPSAEAGQDQDVSEVPVDGESTDPAEGKAADVVSAAARSEDQAAGIGVGSTVGVASPGVSAASSVVHEDHEDVEEPVGDASVEAAKSLDDASRSGDSGPGAWASSPVEEVGPKVAGASSA